MRRVCSRSAGLATLVSPLVSKAVVRAKPELRLSPCARVLVPEDDIETLDLLAFCETFGRPVLLKSGEDETTTDSVCHSVLSVVRTQFAFSIVQLPVLKPSPRTPRSLLQSESAS